MLWWAVPIRPPGAARRAAAEPVHVEVEPLGERLARHPLQEQHVVGEVREQGRALVESERFAHALLALQVPGQEPFAGSRALAERAGSRGLQRRADPQRRATARLSGEAVACVVTFSAVVSVTTPVGTPRNAVIRSSVVGR